MYAEISCGSRREISFDESQALWGRAGVREKGEKKAAMGRIDRMDRGRKDDS